MSKLTIPNLLTILRVSLIPIFVITFYLPFKSNHIVTAIIFIIAAFTDWLDGFLARKLHQFSAFGEFLDPVADKLIVAVALLLLVESHCTPWLSIPAAIIVCREIVISALREWMAEIGKRANIAVSYIGKIKTSLQMVAITFLLSQPPLVEVTNKLADSSVAINQISYAIIILGYIFLYIAVILTIWSMLLYLRVARKNFS